LKGIKCFIEANGGVEAFARLQTAKVYEKFIKDEKTATFAAQESYCTFTNQSPGVIDSMTAFVSHAWRHEFLDVVAALEDWETLGRRPTVFCFDTGTS